MQRMILEGRKFGRWEVLSYVGQKHHQSLYKVRCDCGREKEVYGGFLKAGRTTACNSCATMRHGQARFGTTTRTYNSWKMMRRRCTHKNATGYEDYGGRGITVCGRWNGSFEHFLEDMGERPIGMSLDRIDVNGNYELSNCRWATTTEQAYNKRANRQ